MQSSVYELHVANAASRLNQLIAYAGTSAAGPHGLRRRVSHRRGEAAQPRRRVDVERRGGRRGACHVAGAECSMRALFHCTLERSPTLKPSWRDVKRRLTAGGVVMVIAPTIDSRTARIFRSAWWEFNARNLHYFSADTLQSLLLKCGFGDTIIDADDSAVSLDYFRGKVPAISSAFYRRAPAARVDDAGVLRRRAFRSLNSRRVMLARSKPCRHRRRCR